MVILDVFYVAIATIVVIAVLQLITFVVVRIIYPPEPTIVYQQVPMPSAPVQAVVSPPIPPPTFTQPTQEIQLPEYESRIAPSSNSSRMDAGLPDGLQETRPPGI